MNAIARTYIGKIGGFISARQAHHIAGFVVRIYIDV